MSWGVSSSGKPADVSASLAQQFKLPLADKPAGLSDDGERETVRRVAELIQQCLGTFGKDRPVAVSASGHMGYRNYDTKEDPYQSVNFKLGVFTNRF